MTKSETLRKLYHSSWGPKCPQCEHGRLSTTKDIMDQDESAPRKIPVSSLQLNDPRIKITTTYRRIVICDSCDYRHVGEISKEATGITP